jgi:hypothetical protein
VGTCPSLGTGIGVAAADQTHEFLRHRLIAPTVLAVLFGHGPANPRSGVVRPVGAVDLQLGRAAGPRRALNSRPIALGGPAPLAGIGASAAHYAVPRLIPVPTRNLQRKLQAILQESSAGRFWFSAARWIVSQWNCARNNLAGSLNDISC